VVDVSQNIFPSNAVRVFGDFPASVQLAGKGNATLARAIQEWSGAEERQSMQHVSSGITRHRSDWPAGEIQRWKEQINIFGDFRHRSDWPARAIQRWKKQVNISGVSRHRSDWPARAIQRWKEQVNISGISRHRSNWPARAIQRWKEQIQHLGDFPASVRLAGKSDATLERTSQCLQGIPGIGPIGRKEHSTLATSRAIQTLVRAVQGRFNACQEQFERSDSTLAVSAGAIRAEQEQSKSKSTPRAMQRRQDRSGIASAFGAGGW
jgi:hypothetical protein